MIRELVRVRSGPDRLPASVHYQVYDDQALLWERIVMLKSPQELFNGIPAFGEAAAAQGDFAAQCRAKKRAAVLRAAATTRPRPESLPPWTLYTQARPTRAPRQVSGFFTGVPVTIS